MIWLNKLVSFFLNPMMIGMILLLAGFALRPLRSWRFKRSPARAALWLNILGVAWLWFWGCNVTTRLLGARLERPYPPALAAEMPQADAVLLLGGGIGGDDTGRLIYPEMGMASDRTWHAARLYKAGRAPYVVPTGSGSSDSERTLLLDFGVPDSAILCESEARNTEEHVALVSAILKQKFPDKQEPLKVLLVTSAWHMRRSLLNFAQSDFEVIPAPADHECMMRAARPLKVTHFFPEADTFYVNSFVFKEYLGYWLYRLKYLLRPRSGHNGECKKGAQPVVVGL